MNLGLVADADDQSVGQMLFEGLHQHQGGFVIKLVGGFVEEQDLRFVQQCTCEAEALLFAAGEDAVPFVWGVQIVDQRVQPTRGVV